MRLFSTPRNLAEAYGLSVFVLRFGGLFPYNYEVVANKLRISWQGYSCTILHLVIYTYVNITSILESWRDFSQPMIGNSGLAAFGNLVLRLLGIVITFVIIAPFVVGSLTQAPATNSYVKILDEFILLGIDVNSIYCRIYRMSRLALAVFLGLVTFTAWHSIYFYTRIVQKPPEFKFYLVATLSTFYELLYMFYVFLQFYIIFAISIELNSYLAKLRDEHHEIYESERKMKYGKITKSAKMV